jgi:DNA polymerase III delta prime subunit
MNQLKIWKLSLGDKYFNDQSFNKLKSENLVSIHPNTPAKGQSHEKQGDLFFKARKGDLVYVCRSNNSVEYIGMFVDERPLYSILEDHEEWVDREISVLVDAINPNEYNKELDKWWAPKNNSTFIRVDDLQLFEKDILIPAFNISIKELKKAAFREKNKLYKGLDFYIELQKKFTKLQKDESFLFTEVNNIKNIELRKLEYELKERSNLKKQPVVYLRSLLTDKLLNNQALSKKVLEDLKNEIAPDYETNVYHAWSSPFRILYTLYFSQFKKELEAYFKKFIKIICNQLELKEFTKVKLNHFDGTQNQGNDRIWFAIYNHTYKSQKHAYQLFFEIHNGITYGLHHMDKKSENQLINTDQLSLRKLINTYSKVLDKIKEDNSMEKAIINDYADVLIEKKQIILQGPPGTGKTRLAKQIARLLTKGDIKTEIEGIDEIKLVQFHPSYTYEDFVRGIVTEIDGNGRLEYKVKDKVFADFARRAQDDPDRIHVVIIDEINRANLPAVLGELIYALEYRGKPVESMYSLKTKNQENREIIVPDNLYIIGTMNTADRSVSHLDYAIRRRFAFIPVLPDESIVTDPKAKELFIEISKLFQNGSLASDFKKEDVQIGHSYFILQKPEDLEFRWEYEILPLLTEYRKDGILLESSKKEIEKLENEVLGK